MKRIPKAVGLGFGIALSTGALCSPAEAQQTHTETTNHSQYNIESNTRTTDTVCAIGFLALGLAAAGAAGNKVWKVAKEKWWDTDSDPYLISEGIPDVLPKYTGLSDDVDAISRDYYDMEQMGLAEFNAEWIAFQAFRTEEL